MLSIPARAGDLVRIRGERWRVSQCLPCGDTAVVDADGDDVTNRGTRARFLLPFEPIERINLSTRPRIVRPSEWRMVARRTLGDATGSWGSLRAAARARCDVVPFQLEPAIAMLRGDGCRFLIADAVGLGKTVQAGLMVAEVFARQPDARAIIIAPAGLREQWRDELLTRFTLDARAMDAAGVARAAAALPVGFNPWAAHPLLITSIDYVKRPEVMRCLESLLWDVVVLDEAHTLAGRSDRASAAAAVAHRGRCVVMLTATPHSGDVDEFVRLSDLGRHGPDEGVLLFSRSHADAGFGRSRRTKLLRVRLTAVERGMHAALAEYGERVWHHTSSADGARLALSVLARRASSSPGSLASSIERRIALLDGVAPPSSEQLGLPFQTTGTDDEVPDSQLGGRGLADSGEELACLRHLLALARDASGAETKIRIVRRLLHRTNEPVIVFTEYRDTLQHLASAVSPLGAVLLHGGLTPHQRREALREFTEGTTRVLLATDAASEGLNLHHRCRLVVNLELPWTPLRLEQRAGRVDRIGQRRRVHALHLVAAGTSEERVLATLAARMSRVRGALGPLAYSPLPTDRDVAAALFASTPLPDPPVAKTTSTGIRLPARGREALEEAARIETARALLRGAATRLDAGRPVITTLSRRRRSGLTSSGLTSIWVFALRVIDRDHRELRHELLPLAITHPPARPEEPPEAEWRTFLDEVSRQRVDAFALDITGSTSLWMAREERLMRALQRQQARLSAGLVQAGLFDRRAERASAAQAALLEEALAQSHERQAQLLARLTPCAGSCDLVLAVAFD